MYLSFRRSQDALLALGFFVLMVVVVFSTLLYVCAFVVVSCLTHVGSSRYFIERGSWDETLEVFINSDGDPSQFAVSP
jgi:potassium voltage-gated channel Shal-related subfamily D member 2